MWSTLGMWIVNLKTIWSYINIYKMIQYLKDILTTTQLERQMSVAHRCGLILWCILWWSSKHFTFIYFMLCVAWLAWLNIIDVSRITNYPHPLTTPIIIECPLRLIWKFDFSIEWGNHLKKWKGTWKWVEGRWGSWVQADICLKNMSCSCNTIW